MKSPTWKELIQERIKLIDKKILTKEEEEKLEKLKEITKDGKNS